MHKEELLLWLLVVTFCFVELYVSVHYLFNKHYIGFKVHEVEFIDTKVGFFREDGSAVYDVLLAFDFNIAYPTC